MIIKNEDIVAYEREGKIWCPECAAKGLDLSKIEEEEVLTSASFKDDNDLIFCDECKGRIL